MVMMIDNYYEIKMPTLLNAGEKIVTNGSDQLVVYDAKGKVVNALYAVKLPQLSKGQHKITFDCKYVDEDAPKLSVYFVTKGNPEPVKTK